MAPSKKLNLTGQRFGKLMAIKDTGKRYRGLADASIFIGQVKHLEFDLIRNQSH